MWKGDTGPKNLPVSRKYRRRAGKIRRQAGNCSRKAEEFSAELIKMRVEHRKVVTKIRRRAEKSHGWCIQLNGIRMLIKIVSDKRQLFLQACRSSSLMLVSYKHKESFLLKNCDYLSEVSIELRHITLSGKSDHYTNWLMLMEMEN